MDKEQEKTLSLLMRAMIKYDGGDVPRIQHFVKAHDFSRMIGMSEGMESRQLFVLEAAAILHDVGIHAAEANYGNSHGKDHLSKEAILSFREKVFRSPSAIEMLNNMWNF